MSCPFFKFWIVHNWFSKRGSRLSAQVFLCSSHSFFKWTSQNWMVPKCIFKLGFRLWAPVFFWSCCWHVLVLKALLLFKICIRFSKEGLSEKWCSEIGVKLWGHAFFRSSCEPLLFLKTVIFPFVFDFCSELHICRNWIFHLFGDLLCSSVGILNLSIIFQAQISTHCWCTGGVLLTVHENSVCDYTRTYSVNVYKISIAYVLFCEHVHKTMPNCVYDHFSCARVLIIWTLHVDTHLFTGTLLSTLCVYVTMHALSVCPLTAKNVICKAK